jgi:uncharacterized protein
LTTRTTSGRSANAAPNYRIQPSVGAAIGLFLAYVVVFIGVAAASGIDYGDWFASAGNVWRSAIAGLAAGTVVLVAFLAWARWDMLWRDPARLPMSPLLWALPALFVVVFVIRFAAVAWGEVSGGLVLACVVAAVIVGFNEEMLLRGFFLRGMRTGGRSEATAVLLTCVAFGLLHLPNAFLGTGLFGLSQVFLAAITGVALYTFRRGFALIVPAMVAHGLWDLSTFFPAGEGAATTVALAGSVVVYVLTLIALVAILRGDRTIAVTREGTVPAGQDAAPRVR